MSGVDSSTWSLHELRKELARWQTFGALIAMPAYVEAYVVCDCNERVVQRIDHPRVATMPTIQYAMPDLTQQNWTLYPGDVAQAAIIVLDEHVPQHAPHRALHLRELANERALAARQGIELLSKLQAEGDLNDLKPW